MNIKQQGASVLEFILMIPVLLMFIVLVGEIGIMFYTMNTLTKTTQDAARYLSGDKAEFANRQATAVSLLKFGNTTSTLPPVLPDGDTKINPTITNTATHVTVSVTYQHDLILGSLLGVLTGLSTGGSLSFGSTYTLTASSVLRFAQ